MRKVVNHLKAPYDDIIENDTLTTRPKDFIYLKIEKKVQKIYLKDILYIESLKKYVKIRLKARKIVTHKTITSVMESLSPKSFLRVHHSFIMTIGQINILSPAEIEVKSMNTYWEKVQRNSEVAFGILLKLATQRRK